MTTDRYDVVIETLFDGVIGIDDFKDTLLGAYSEIRNAATASGAAVILSATCLTNEACFHFFIDAATPEGAVADGTKLIESHLRHPYGGSLVVSPVSVEVAA